MPSYLTIDFVFIVHVSVGYRKMPITFSVNNFVFPVLLARYFSLHDKMRKDSLRIEVKILFKRANF